MDKGIPFWWWRGRPTTQETKTVSIKTEVAIPLLQALVIACLWVAGGMLTLAALVAWGRTEWTAVATMLAGFALSALVVWAMVKVGEAAQEERVSSGQSLGAVALLLCAGLVGVAALFWGWYDLLPYLRGLDITCIRLAIVIGGSAFALSTGIKLARSHLGAALVFMLIIAIGAGALYWHISAMALSAWWPWFLSFVALGVDLAGVLLFRALKRELVNPYLPLPPHEQIMLEWLERSLPEPKEVHREWSPVLLNPLRQSAADRLWGKFQAFVHAAAVNTSQRRLERLGFTRSEINRWRDVLIRAGWAEWVQPGNPRAGWRLTALPEEILANLDTEEIVSSPTETERLEI
jgi:hypothetical protein